MIELRFAYIIFCIILSALGVSAHLLFSIVGAPEVASIPFFLRAYQDQSHPLRGFLTAFDRLESHSFTNVRLNLNCHGKPSIQQGETTSSWDREFVIDLKTYWLGLG